MSRLLLLVSALCGGFTCAAPLRARVARQQLSPSSLVQLSVSEDASLQLTVARPSLKEYCSGDSAGTFDEGTPVRADWRNYGSFYPGKVLEKNNNGTFDILYDDGWKEKNVKANNVKPAKGVKKLDPKDDPACELSDTTEKIDKKVAKVKRLVGRYVAEKESESIRSRADESEVREKEREEALEKAEESSREYVEDYRSRLKAIKDSEKGDVEKEKAVEEELEAAKEKAEKEEEGLVTDVKVEILKTETEIHEMEKEVEENDKKISELREDKEVKHLKRSSTDHHEVDEESDPSDPTLDDLLASYRHRLAARRKRLKELREILREQAEDIEELSRDEDTGVTVDEIMKAIEDISTDVQEAEAKRDKLRKEGRLDDELNHAIDQVSEDVEKLIAKAERIRAAEKAAEEAEEAAKAAEAKAAQEEREEEEERRLRMERLQAKAKAAEEAAAKAEAEAEAAEEAEKAAKKAEARAARQAAAAAEAQEKAQEAKDAARRKARQEERMRKAAEARAAQQATIDAAKEAHKEAVEVATKSDHLNAGLTPHGEKWWRYRYEYSFVEAGLMIWIVFFMLFWEFVYQQMRRYSRSFIVGGHKRLQMMEQANLGTIQENWLENFADMFVICVLTFLTVWTLAQLGLFEKTPIMLAVDDRMHMPGDKETYRRMAIDLCAILFFAIFNYFLLMYAVVRATGAALVIWQEEHDRQKHIRAKSVMTHIATFAVSNSVVSVEYADLKKYFQKYIKEDEGLDPSMKQEMAASGFPFWLYLRLSVKGTVGLMYEFGVFVWGLIVITFFVMLMLHMWAHTGYIRIMMFYAGLTTVLLLTMTYVIFKYNSDLTEGLEAEASAEAGDSPSTTASSGTSLVAYEWLFFAVMNYFVFMLCYGFARMVCTSWMWELYFWNVVYLLAVTIVLAIFFVLVIAPLVPMFAALSTLPPHLNERHKELAVDLFENKVPESAASSPRLGSKGPQKGDVVF